MKLRRSSLWVLFLGCSFLLFGLTPIIYSKIHTANSGYIGIIGGAEVPNYKLMLFFLLDSLPFILISLGIALIVSAAFCLLFQNAAKTHCNISTSIISAGLSAIGALGLIFVFLWFSIVSFGEMSKHPIEYPLSILLGVFCLLAFFVLIIVYIKMRKSNWSIKGIIIDISTSIIYLPFFFLTFINFIERIS
ncbi:MAG: hypothetical protein E7531_04895 [Ruminococcaceae bacterium]|nr:hypothetical protein [Oscillospiraceae bacterium]